MKHLGDITKMTPFCTDPVDCVTFGSPCQDLSIAGKRAGLAGERSGLFMEAVRVIKDMRLNTFGAYPTFAVWENVPGAFSSNKGEDFHAVLEELAHIVEPEVSIPRPENGKWAKAGFVSGNGWSLAWRTFDAQFWGVPQRRRRIALVVDFGGQRAGEILFERTSLRGDSEPSIPAWKGVARNPAHGPAGHDRVAEGATSYTLKIRSGYEGGGKCPLVQTEKSATLSTLQDKTLFVLQGNMIDRDVKQNGSGVSEGETMYSLTSTDRHGVCCAGVLRLDNGSASPFAGYEIAPTIRQGAGPNGAAHVAVCYGITSLSSNSMKSSNPHSGFFETTVCKTLDLNAGNPTCNQGGVEVVQVVNSPYQQNTGPLMANSHPGSYCGQSIQVEDGRVSPTLRAERHAHEPVVMCRAHGQANAETLDDCCPTLNCNHEQPIVFESHSQDARYTQQGDPSPACTAQWGTGGNNMPLVAEKHEFQNTGIGWWNQSETGATLRTPCGGDSTKANVIVENRQLRWIVRRLTPTECERLQGFPDGWTDIGEWVDTKGKRRKTTDSPRYKALGNSIALPQWWWITCKMARYLPEKPTLGSLFDGIGGFPLVWETKHGNGTAVWASEIEKFPIAVTKMRFGEEVQ